MRFTCKRARLAEVAGLVGQAVSGKSTKKIFECIRIDASDSGLELSGTDLEVAVRYRVSEDVDVKEAGEAVVPAQLFAGVLREIGDEQVTLSVARRKMTLETDGGFFELECEDASQYPEIPAFPDSSAGKLPAAELRALVRKTSFAAGKEAARFVLNGVQVTADSDTLRFVATDGRRLAKLERPFGRTGEGKPLTAIVGVKGLQHFERLSAGQDGEREVEIAIADRFVALRTADAEATVRVMDGNFPDVSQIIPRDCPGKAQVPAGVWAARLRQVQQFASLESQAVVVKFKPGELGLSAAGGDGRAEVRISVDYDGEEVKIGFNPAYILDALKVIDGDQASVEFSDRNSAAKITDASGFLYVIMPVLID
ncbi:MAG: DNA polymerase III subunit beta [Planctomycetota bacterium]|jgi:DNA polymerase-3 subunit beta